MKYILTEKDIDVIKSALNAHIKQCDDFIKLNGQSNRYTSSEKIHVEEKIDIMKNLLKNM